MLRDLDETALDVQKDSNASSVDSLPSASQPSSALDRLARATAEAVRESQQEMGKIRSRVEQLTEFFSQTAQQVQAIRIEKIETELFETVATELIRTSHEIDELFQRQSSVLQTFNIVLFGRTGAGKSSLISAMTRGNGESVSLGESDWTISVQPSEWHSCRIYDTPGINGWGRTDGRDALEARAREAVEIADLVIVCFDSQSQQAEEFRKLADWVMTYRKPTIAVLNVRNHVWRMPVRVPIGSARASLSQAVREHAGNIRDELAKIGLTAVPIVALNSKRALFARASLPYKGPDGATLELQRTEFGTDRLEEWSGYSRLERLLLRTISEHSVSLRIGALNDKLRGKLDQLRRGLQELEGSARDLAETLEHNTVAPLLRLVGYPSHDDEERWASLRRDGRDLLDELEHMRGGAFQAPGHGEFRQFVEQRLATELGALRSASLQAAEECVVAAFDRNENLTEADVRAASFDENRIQDTVQSVLQEAIEFLESRVKLAMRDAVVDLDILARAASVEGATGVWWKRTATGLRVGGILSGAVGILAAIVASNIWNPIGWGAAIAGGLLSIFGRKARQKAEKKRLEARREALAQVRKNIHQVYNDVRDQVLEHADQIIVRVSGELLSVQVEQALAYRTLQHQCSTLSGQIQQVSKELPVHENPQALVWSVATKLEREAFSERPDAHRRYWLGEDWVDDPVGLELSHGSTGAGRTTAYDPRLYERLFIALRGVFERLTEKVAPGSGIRWLDNALEQCAGDEEALSTLAELKRIVDAGKPRLHIIGDYNAGKTSFIKRLLIDSGGDVPSTLEVRADPTTVLAKEYEWNDMTIVDTPGFQSGDTSHTEEAYRALPDASAIIYLFQPNLIVGDDSSLIDVLRGNRDLGLVPKRSRTFFIINRADELGVDPELAPEAYFQLVERKKTELSLALRSRGIEVDPGDIFCMASDPYGLVGNRIDVDSSAFDPYRSWDGFHYFMSELNKLKGRVLRSGVDRSALEGGIARLRRLQTAQETIIQDLLQKDGAVERLHRQIDEALSEGRRLSQQYRSELERIVVEQASEFRDELLSEMNPDNFRLKLRAFQEYWNDQALQVEIVQWATEAAQAFDAWRQKAEDEITRRLASIEFRAAFGEYAGSGLGVPEMSGGPTQLGRVTGAAGSGLKSISRDTVYKVGKALGHKFKPWGAVKLAKSLAKLGPWLTAAGTILDIIDWRRDEERRKNIEVARKKISRFIQESVADIVLQVGYGTEDEPAVLRTLDLALGELEDVGRSQALQRDDFAREIEMRRRKVELYCRLQDEAEKLLGDPWEES